MRRRIIVAGLMLATALVTVNLVAAAEPGAAGKKPPVEHKLIYVNGVHSVTMAGDGTDTPIIQNVLPRLLADGWLIKSVHVHRDEKAQKVGGYVVLERARR